MCRDARSRTERATSTRFQCRTRHYVCRDISANIFSMSLLMFQCRTRHYVCREWRTSSWSAMEPTFQCRTQHCVCRDEEYATVQRCKAQFQCRTQHCVCRDSTSTKASMSCAVSFNVARGIMCVGTLRVWCDRYESMGVSMPHAALCVSGHQAVRYVQEGS